MIEIHGIPNCDTMKKARRWLEEHGIGYRFHDFRKEGVEEQRLREWADQVGWETLLNRRGMMWRRLPQEVRDGIDEQRALRIMRETPSIIRRPVLVKDGRVTVGFSEETYRELLESE